MQPIHAPTGSQPGRQPTPFKPLFCQPALQAPTELPEWSDPQWRDLPYRSVLAVLPDKSSFYLPGEALAWYAAGKVVCADLSVRTHLARQIVPLVAELPTALIEIAKQLTWAEARQIAAQPFWRSPAALKGPRLWAQAELSLNAFRCG